MPLSQEAENRLLDRIQTAIENIARVMDKHGEISVEEPNEPYYSLGIAQTYLEEAERQLEGEAS